LIPSDYLPVYGAPEKPAYLSKLRLIRHINNSSANYWHFKDCSSTRTIHTRGYLLMDSDDVMLRATLNHGGIDMLSTYMTARHI
jgi:hypothetical protein